MQKYTIVKFIEEIDEGSLFSAAKWPTHLTIAGNFIIEYNQSLISELQQIMDNHHQFEAVVGEDDYFGTSQSVEVSLIEPTPELLGLHNDTISVLASTGAIFDEPHYTKSGYRPHVTVRGRHRMYKGEKFLVDQISIVDMYPNADIGMRKVLKNIDIGRTQA